MVNDIPRWAEDLVGPKLQTDENIRSAQVLQESPLGKMAVTYTNERIFLTQKKTLGRSQVFELDPPMDPFASQADRVTCTECGDSFRTWNADQLESLRCLSCGTAIPLDGSGSEVASEVPDVPDAAGEVTREVPEAPEITEEPATEEAGPEPEPPKPDDDHDPFVVDDYTLYQREVPTGSGGTRTMRFFAKNAPEDGTAIPLPDGYDVGRNERSGLPYLQRAEEGAQDADGSTPTPSDSLLAIHGVGPSFAEKLAGAGVPDVPSLLEADPESLAEETGVGATRIASFQTLGGLLDVKGIGPKHGQTLLDLGITSIEDLAEADPTDISGIEGISVNRARSFIQSARNKTQGHR